MRLIGLTGSIGMGKSTTLRLFAEEGCAVWDADAAVHRLYGQGGAAVAPVEAAFPGVTVDGSIDRPRLAASLAGDADRFRVLEAIVHPLVQADRAAWLEALRDAGAAFAVIDVPLLFEVGGDAEVDAVVVVSAPAEIQRARVLARPGMTPERFEQIVARQMPDADKRERADFVIDTGDTVEAARDQVRVILAILSTPDWRSHRPGALHTGAEAAD